MVFTKYRFETALSPSELLERLGAMVTQRFVMIMFRRGSLYGRITNDRFELRTARTRRGSNVIWVVGRIDLAAMKASGTLRIIPDALGSVAFVMIVAVAVGLQFLPAAGWLRVAFPAFAVVTAVWGIWLGRAEWRTIVDRLRNETGLTLVGH